MIVRAKALTLLILLTSLTGCSEAASPAASITVALDKLGDVFAAGMPLSNFAAFYGVKMKDEYEALLGASDDSSFEIAGVKLQGTHTLLAAASENFARANAEWPSVGLFVERGDATKLGDMAGVLRKFSSVGAEVKLPAVPYSPVASELITTRDQTRINLAGLLAIYAVETSKAALGLVANPNITTPAAIANATSQLNGRWGFTGFWAGGYDSKLLTAAHCVAGRNLPYMTQPDGTQVTATKVWHGRSKPGTDIAVVSFPPGTYRGGGLPLSFQNVSPGTQVNFAGFASGSLNCGSSTAMAEEDPYWVDEGLGSQAGSLFLAADPTSAHLQHGDSGGPAWVYDDNGNPLAIGTNKGGGDTQTLITPLLSNQQEVLQALGEP